MAVANQIKTRTAPQWSRWAQWTGSGFSWPVVCPDGRLVSCHLRGYRLLDHLRSPTCPDERSKFQAFRVVVAHTGPNRASYHAGTRRLVAIGLDLTCGPVAEAGLKLTGLLATSVEVLLHCLPVWNPGQVLAMLRGLPQRSCPWVAGGGECFADHPLEGDLMTHGIETGQGGAPDDGGASRAARQTVRKGLVLVTRRPSSLVDLSSRSKKVSTASRLPSWVYPGSNTFSILTPLGPPSRGWRSCQLGYSLPRSPDRPTSQGNAYMISPRRVRHAATAVTARGRACMG